MMIEKVITSLLENACASIRYRVRTEILKQSIDEKELAELQARILQDELVQEVMRWQGSDRWRSASFHGTPGIETAVRVLREKGMSENHPAITSALEALRKYPEILERGIGRAGSALDVQGFGGSQMIRAVVFAYAGADHEPCVDEQIRVALDGFRFVHSIRDLREVTRRYGHHLVFRPGVMFPGIYHLRLLAYTRSWRTPENIRLVARGVKRLAALSPLPGIHILHRGQVVAPASFAMQNFNPSLAEMKDVEWMSWFHRTEMLARMGMIPAIPQLRRQVGELDRMLKQGGGWFTKKLSHRSFMKWNTYIGLCLEMDWHSPQRRMYDLTFRCLLIKSLP